MALRRWVSLARYDGAEMLIATQCPPDGRNRLVVRGYARSNLSAFGFEQVSPGSWLGETASFKTSDLRAWFPGFDPARDLKEMDTSSFLMGYEDLDLVEDDTPISALIERATRAPTGGSPSAARPPQTHEEWVTSVRLSASAEAIAAVVASFPEEDAERAFSSEIDPASRQHYLNDFAITKRGGDQARAQVVSLLQAAREKLADDVARYNDLRERGVDALSNYDLGIAYSGDAVMGVRQTLRLKEGHILYQRKRIGVLRELEASLENQATIDQPRAAHSTSPTVSGSIEADQPQDETPNPEVAPDAEPSASTPVGPTPRRQIKSAERQRARIEDAGEKIGGARKDFYAKALSRSDLDGMNDREKLELVTRDNIWPRKSMAQFREDDVDARVALFVTGLRKQLPASVSNPEHVEAYLDLVTKLRDLTSTLYRTEEVASRTWDGESQTAYFRGLEEAGILEVERDEQGQWKRKHVATEYQVFLNVDVRSRKAMYDFLSDPSGGYRKSKQAYDGRSFWINDERVTPRDMDSDALYDFMERQQQKTADRSAKTREARAAAKEGEEKADYLSRPHLDHLERSGLPDERGGRAISPDDFLSSFGFRACEFGNWLPDIERQDVLNRAYDSLSTLARVLGVPKTFISLNSTLAVAFGARGVGRAAAHYEPARKVINLTRMSGAGSLAHEFFHALDDHLGEHVKTLSKGARTHGRLNNSYFATELFLTQKRHGSGYRNNEIAQDGYLPAELSARLSPLITAVNSMTVRHRTAEEAQILVEQNLGILRNNSRIWISNALHITMPGANYEERSRQAAAFEASAYGEVVEGNGSTWAGEQHPLVERISGMFKHGVGKAATKDQAKTLRQNLKGLEDTLSRIPEVHRLMTDQDALMASKYVGSQGLVNTTYFKHAEAIDEGKSSKYWSTVLELAARSFESYVQDRCAERGWRDDYLVHGTEESRFESAAHSPYPMGDERKRINEAFGGLIELVKNELVASDEHDDEGAPATSQAARPKAA